jgi:transcriptional regulator with XRE-family HTH domain
MQEIRSAGSDGARELLSVNVVVGRARTRLSQHALAERSGVSRPTISRIERAAVDVGIDAIERIATALGMQVSELFVPGDTGILDDAELARRAAAPNREFVDADALLAAIDEADSGNAGGTGVDAKRSRVRRFSRAGRPPVGR